MKRIGLGRFGIMFSELEIFRSYCDIFL